jgi:MYXO-CTERM domain-containing protein
MSRLAVGLRMALALGLGLSSGWASASTGYPAEIQAQLQLTYTPGCSICHSDGDTDAGTVTTPFGTTLVTFGLVGGNNLPSLDGALEGLEGEHSPYIGYLQEGLDPNNPNTGSTPPLAYGCSTTGHSPSAHAAALLLLALGLLFLSHSRRLSNTGKP